MAQHDYVIANGTGAAVRSDLNNALAAIVSQNSGATEPATTYAYQFWADTTTATLKLRNSANSAWIELMQLDGTLTMEDGTEALPGLSFRNDLDTGLWRPGANQLAISTNAVERVEFGASEVVFNDGGANYDFRVEGDTNANLLFVDASADAVGIGTSSPGEQLTVSNGSIRIEGAGAQEFVTFVNTSTGGRHWTLANAGASNVHSVSAGTFYLRDSTAGANRVAIDSSGRVGIGVTTPGEKLSVEGKIEARSGNWFLARSGDNSNYAYINNPETSASALGFFTSGEKMRLDSSGRLLVGTSTARSNINRKNTTGITPFAQIESAVQSYNSGLSIINNSAAAYGAMLTIGTSYSTSIGSNTIGSSGNQVGTINFVANDGTNFIDCAQIMAEIGGTPGTNDMPGNLVFSTTADGASSPTERMRITQGGIVGIGSSAPSGWVSTRQVIQVGRAASACDTSVSNGGSSIFSNNFFFDGNDKAIATGYSQGIVFNPTGAGTTQVVSTSGTNTGGNTITFAGGPYVTAGGTSWTSSSDERLKNIVEPISNGLEKIADIRAVKFSWKDDPDARVNVGVIAQDVETVLPEIVSKSQKYGSDDQTEYLGVSYDLLAPLLIAALQEAKTKIETLEAKVAALESA